MTDATKSQAQIDHEARNTAARRAKSQRRHDRFFAHLERNQDAAADAIARRVARIDKHEAANREAAAMASMRRTDRMVDHIRANHNAKASAAIARGETVDPYAFRQAMYADLRALIDPSATTVAPVNDNAEVAKAA